MTRHNATKPIALPRPSSVSGARPLTRNLASELGEDSWLEVDDVYIEAIDVDERSATQRPTAPDLATLTEQHAAEMARVHVEYQARLATLQQERDAARERVAQLEALLATPAAAQPPPLPPAPTAREVHAPSPPPPDAAPRERTPKAPIPIASSSTTPRAAHQVPTLSDVLVATDIDAESGAERRSTPRLARQFELEFNYETHFYAGLSLDISTGGLFIATYHLLPVGTLLWLSFSLPNDTRISVQGEVRWVRSSDEGHERPGMGVAFKQLSTEALSKITEFCAERPPLYIDL